MLNDSTKQTQRNKSVAFNKDEVFPITKQDGGTELNNESIKYVDQTENQERFSNVKYGGINTGNTINTEHDETLNDTKKQLEPSMLTPGK